MCCILGLIKCKLIAQWKGTQAIADRE